MPVFPIISILDSFQRLEEPLSNGGKWKEVEPAEGVGKLIGTAWETLSPSPEGAWWTSKEFENPGVALEFKEFIGIEPEDTYFLYACLSDPEEALKYSGYRLKLTNQEESTGKFVYQLEKVVAHIATPLGSSTEINMSPHDRFGLSVEGGKVTSWHKSGEGSWTEIKAVSDSTYTTGYVGFYAATFVGHLINFEAGAAGEESEMPTVESPGKQRSAISKPISLQIHATHTEKYESEGLPEGLTINETTGLITGTPIKLESVKVKIKVKGLEGEASTEFEWNIEEHLSHKKNNTYVIIG